jgi:hypothetical protein
MFHQRINAAFRGRPTICEIFDRLHSLGFSMNQRQMQKPSSVIDSRSVMLLDWTLTGLDIFGWILDGLDRRRSAIGWIGLILVNPIGSNYLKGLAGTWLKYIATVAASRDASAFVSSSLLL